MNFARLFEWLDQHRRAIYLVMAPVLIILVGGVYLFVYLTGGIKFVYSHSMYFPILLAGVVFGIKGGVLIGLLGGLVLGPFMPINVATGELQETGNWLYRTGFFALIGFLSGAATDSVTSYLAHLKWLSQHDIATELPNRNALFGRLSELAGEKSPSASRILVAVSFENMLELKSAFGFAVIEEAISQLARRIEGNRIKSSVYRTATEQIAVLAQMDGHEADDLLEELIEAVQEPIRYKEIPIHIDTRMGTVQFRRVEKAPAFYLQRAEAALAVAQERAQDSVAYSAEIVTNAEENLAILGELKGALRQGHLFLNYQPKIFMTTGQVRGAEALLGWDHPERGRICPEIFIPRAEQSTLIQLVTEFVLEQAMAQIVQWRRQYDINVPVAVNISPRSLLHPGFTDLVSGLLDRYGISGDCLEFEVTESLLVMDMKRTINELSRLAELKIVISIDDFGTGYSSLQYLHQLPVSSVKLDQSFVRRLSADKSAAHVLEAAVVLAHKMGIQTIAEGVENREVYDFLERLGCDMVQGFLVSRPLPGKDFAEWYRQCNGRYNCAYKL
ncbi:MAG: GGDEF domain-containing protein [Desulfobacterales bacterium]|nr:GGDEF domain-containing protein [Desulfobacterales bacterium]